MKKHFKLMSLLLGIMVSVFAFTACGSDDDDDNTTNGGGIQNRIIGTWIWGEPGAPVHEEHHASGYVFKANGDCSFYEHFMDNGTVMSGTTKAGTFTVDGINLHITWKTITYQAQGETNTITQPENDEVEIMYTEDTDKAVFFKRYHTTSDGRQGWTEEGPFYKQ